MTASLADADNLSPDQPEEHCRSWPGLDRFVLAQQDVYPVALAEIRAGRKRTHWMWFIFPQHRALGRSATAVRYGLVAIDEARAYLDHPLLGARLRQCTDAMLGAAPALGAHDILGSPDDLNFQ